ncbi:MAG: hypothetical protein ACT4OS_00160 [Acidimicrobiales bacterium]
MRQWFGGAGATRGRATERARAVAGFRPARLVAAHRKARAAGQEGSALVLALVFVTVVSLLIAGTLTLSGAGIRFGDQIAQSRTNLFAADSAIQTAIAATTQTVATGAVVCPPLDGVACSPPPAEGPVTPTGGPAIVAFGTHPDEGLEQVDPGGLLRVGGDIISNSKVEALVAPKGIDVDTQASVTARGACTGNLVTSDRRCAGDPDAPTVDQAVPAFAADLSPAAAPGPPQTVPGCAPVMTLAPGYYDDAEALKALTDGRPGCTNPRILHLPPGSYYFDLNHGAPASAACTGNPAPECTWTIDDPDLTIVGGHPRGWDPVTVTPTTLPDNPCRTASDPTPNEGVQLIFGGQSRLDHHAGRVKICGRGGVERIAAFGLRPESVPAPPNDGAVPGIQGSVAANSGFVFQDNAVAIDNNPATATLALVGAQASLTLAGFPNTGIPAGSQILGATIRVHHWNSEANVLDPKLTVSVGGTPVGPATELSETCIDSTCPEASVSVGSLTRAQISTIEARFDVMRTGGPDAQSAALDGIVLDVTYRPPAYEALGGCHAVIPYGAPQSCAVLKSSASKDLSIEGKVFAPTGVVDLGGTEVAGPVVSGSILVRTLTLSLAPKDTYTGPALGSDAGFGAGLGQALLALGTDADDGIVRRGSAALDIGGDVFSHAGIDRAGGPLAVDGRVAAVGTCAGVTSTERPLVCSGQPSGPAEASSAPDPAFVPPAFPPGADPVVPPCGPTTDALTLAPGIYRDLSSLETLTTGPGCGARVIHFTPGTYSFEFGTGDPFTPCTGTTCVWDVDRDVALVAGVPTWSADPPDPVPFPGGCKTGDSAGASLVFGGESRLNLTAGSLEVCAGVGDQADDRPLAIFGQRPLGGADEVVTVGLATEPTVGDFAPRANSHRIGDGLAQSNIDALGGSASVTLAGFAPVPAVESTLVSLELKVAHREDQGSGLTTDDFTLAALAPGPGSPTLTLNPTSPPICGGPSLCTDTLAVSGVDIDDLGDLAVTYTASRGEGANQAFLDGMELKVTYIPPSFTPQSGCAVTTGFECPILKASGTAGVAIHGIVYAPAGSVDVDVTGVRGPVFNREVVARAIGLGAERDPSFDGPVVGSSAGTGSLPGYLFTYRDDVRPRLRARVSFPASGPPTIHAWDNFPDDD